MWLHQCAYRSRSNVRVEKREISCKSRKTKISAFFLLFCRLPCELVRVIPGGLCQGERRRGQRRRTRGRRTLRVLGEEESGRREEEQEGEEEEEEERRDE